MFPLYNTTKKCKGKQFGEHGRTKKTQDHARKSIMLQVMDTNVLGCRWSWDFPSTSPQTLLSVPWVFLRAREYANTHLPSLPTTLPPGIPWAFSMFSESLLKLVHSCVPLFVPFKEAPFPNATKLRHHHAAWSPVFPELLKNRKKERKKKKSYLILFCSLGPMTYGSFVSIYIYKRLSDHRSDWKMEW